jgi:hypothetical protein
MARQHDKLAVSATAVTVVQLQVLRMRGLGADLSASQTVSNVAFDISAVAVVANTVMEEGGGVSHRRGHAIL